MKVFRFFRAQLRRCGWDVIRFRQRPELPLSQFLRRFGVDLVIDVGANEGQFGSLLRSLGYEGRILSVEPSSEAFSKLSVNAAADGKWKCINVALGETKRKHVLNISRFSMFSSLLETTSYVNELDDGSVVQGHESIDVTTLDELWAERRLGGRVLLKLDTQGYERPILLGARACLPQICSVQLELSLEPIYTGQPRIEEMIALLRELGFSMYTVWKGFEDHKTGAVLEVDGLFLRR